MPCPRAPRTAPGPTAAAAVALTVQAALPAPPHPKQALHTMDVSKY